MKLKAHAVRAAMALAALGAQPASAQSDECVEVAGKQLRPSDIYDESHRCGTCAGQHDWADLCKALNHLMVPDWGAKSDNVIVPHRGLWGQGPEYASENTLHALNAALAQGYRIVEIDVALSDSHNNVRTPFLGHYFTLAANNGYRPQSPLSLSGETISRLKMNRRDQTPSTDPEDSMALLKDVIAWAVKNQVVLMVDPKIPQTPKEERLGAFADIFAAVLAAAARQGRESPDGYGNIILKTTLDPIALISSIKVRLYSAYKIDFESIRNKILWNPITNSTLGERTPENAAAFVESWSGIAGDGKGIASVETNIFSEHDPLGQKFNYNGNMYQGIMDFVKGLTKLGKRSALWSVDPMGNKGTLGREYNWKFIGNVVKAQNYDLRGDMVYTMGYPLSPYALITTDRPDVFKAMVGDAR